MITLLDAMERKESAKRIRRQGLVPCSIYGPGVERNMDIQIEEKEINRFLKSHSIGAKTKVKINGNELPCVIKSIQYEPLSTKPMHIEFYTSSEDRLVKVKVPLKFKGKEQLSRNNLVLNILKDDIEIEGVLKELPEFVEIDVSLMKDGSVITMGDVALPAGIKLLSKKEEAVLRVAEASQPEQGEIAS